MLACFTQLNSPSVKKSSIFAVIEFKYSRALLKELPFFGEKKIETGAVDLLIIRLYLGKIGIDRKIERGIICNPIFNIESGIQRGIIPSCITRPIWIE